MRKKRKTTGHFGYKKTYGASYGKIYVVDIDHLDDTSAAHPIDIRSLKSKYPNIGETIESHIGDIRRSVYPPLGIRKVTLQRVKKGNMKETSLGSTEYLLDKVTKLTGKTLPSPLRNKIVSSVYPPLGIALVEHGDIIKIINNDGRK